MNFIELLLISLALSVDCFIISIFITSLSKVKPATYFSIPLHFALFHAVMILIGYNLGALFKTVIQGFDHWIAFILLAGVGAKIIIESLSKEEKKIPSLTSEWKILVYSFATSLDALIIGLTFSFSSVPLNPSALIVGLTVLIVSILGLVLGRKLRRYKIKYLDLIAGAVLISLGLRILSTHLM